MEFSMDYKSSAKEKLVKYREGEEESTCLKFSVTIVEDGFPEKTS